MRSVSVWLAIACVLGAIGLVAVAWAASVPLGVAPASAATRQRNPARTSVPYRGDSLVRAVVGKNVFRADRRPASVSYEPRRLMEVPAIPLPRPTLLLVGLVAGASPAAIIEGFPGVEGGRVVRERDQIAGLTVRRIDPDRVVVVGMDTTWVLKVREPWRN